MKKNYWIKWIAVFTLGSMTHFIFSDTLFEVEHRILTRLAEIEQESVDSDQSDQDETQESENEECVRENEMGCWIRDEENNDENCDVFLRLKDNPDETMCLSVHYIDIERKNIPNIEYRDTLLNIERKNIPNIEYIEYRDTLLNIERKRILNIEKLPLIREQIPNQYHITSIEESQDEAQ